MTVCQGAWQRNAVLCRVRTFLSTGRMTTGVPQIVVQLENSSGSVAVAGMASGHSGGTRWRGDDVSLSVVRTTEEPSPRLLRDGRTGSGGAGTATHGCRGGQSGETAGRRGPQETPREALAGAFADLHALLKELETWPQHGKVFIYREECSRGSCCSQANLQGEKTSKPNKVRWTCF